MTIPYTEHLRSDGAKMADAASAGDLDAHVPTCPDWNVAKLLIHTGGHHRWVADAVWGGGKEPADPGKPGLRGEELIEWFRQGWSDLADLLDHTSDETPAWTWSSEQRVGFWRRRTTLETLVHRWDVENAVAEGTPLDPELAADGVAEIFTVMVEPGDKNQGRKKGRALLEMAGRGDAWLVDLSGDTVPAPQVAPTGSDADVVLRASAPDMLLYLWGRKGTEVLEHEGDDEMAQAFDHWTKN